MILFLRSTGLCKCKILFSFTSDGFFLLFYTENESQKRNLRILSRLVSLFNIILLYIDPGQAVRIGNAPV